MAEQYYLMSIKWTKGDNIVWWGPNDSGYTDDIENAGIYSAEQIKQRSIYYSNQGVMPVAVAKVQQANKRITISNDSKAVELFGIYEHLKTAPEY